MVYSCLEIQLRLPQLIFVGVFWSFFRGMILSRQAEVIRSHLTRLNGVFLAGWRSRAAAGTAEEPGRLNSAILLGGSEPAPVTGELPGMMDGAGSTPERESSDLYGPSCNNSITQPP